MRTFRHYFPGILLIIIAIVIVAVPEILVAFIASLIFMAGIGALYMGYKIRKSELEINRLDNWGFRDDFFGVSFARMPRFKCRRW